MLIFIQSQFKISCIYGIPGFPEMDLKQMTCLKATYLNVFKALIERAFYHCYSLYIYHLH